MLRVDYDYQIFSAQEFGGISRYFFELAKRVGRSEGFSASIIAPLYINRYLDDSGVYVKGLRIPSIPKMGRVVTALNGVASRLNYIGSSSPDILHETYFASDSVAPHGCPTVITVYDMIHEKFPAFFPRGDITSANKRTAVDRASHVICISENTRHDLVSLYGIAPEKTTVVHLGFSLDSVRNEAPETMTALPPFVLYVGDRAGYKNFDCLLYAFASSPTLRSEYVLLAFGSKPFSGVEQELIRKNGLDESRVRQISGNDSILASLYQRASMFVYPSLYEGFGIPPLEAMSFNCPVICSNTSSLPEVVGDGGYLFDPKNVDELRYAMETVAASSELRTQLVQRGRARLQNFSWDRCATETMQVYREVA